MSICLEKAEAVDFPEVLSTWRGTQRWGKTSKHQGGRQPVLGSLKLKANRKEGEPMQEVNHQPPDQLHGGDGSTMSRRLDGPSEKPHVPMGKSADLRVDCQTCC